MKIGIVSSVGGHLSEVLQLRPLFERHQHFFVLNDTKLLPSFMEGSTYFIRHSERDLLTLYNLWECYRIFRRERPDVLLSAGAGPAVPAFAVAGLMGTARIFVESFCAIKRPTLTGRIIHTMRWCEHFLYQWPSLAAFYPRGSYGGMVYEPPGDPRASEEPETGLVFVTVGNPREPFTRMLRMVEAALAQERMYNVRWQVGYTPYRPAFGRVDRYLEPAEFQAMLRRAALVLCQGGEGSVMEAIHAGHRPIVLPRRKRNGEHINDHQLELTDELGRRGWIQVAETAETLQATLRTGTTRRQPGESGTPLLTIHETVTRLLDQLSGAPT